MKLAGRDLSELSLEQLTSSLAAMQDAGNNRLEASRHYKFDKANNPKAILFPANGSAFENLKIAIQEEIGKRK